MNSNKDNKILMFLFSISCVLMASAIILIDVSFAKPSSDTNIDFNISLTDVITDNDFMINNNMLEFKINLDQDHKDNFIRFTINNKGNMDLSLEEVIKTDLSKEEVGKINDKTYYLSDYVDIYEIYYLSNNINGCYENEILSKGDLLKKGTFNDVELIFSLKDNLTDEMISLMNSKLEFNMIYGVKYLEK